MAEKSDDIKQLFSHLGLNPSDYREIRSAPSASATVSEAPRRWSLLQSVPRAANAPLATIRPAGTVAAKASVLPQALLAALPQAAAVAAPVPPVAAPAVAAPVSSRGAVREELASVFQSAATARIAMTAPDALPSIRFSEQTRTCSARAAPATRSFESAPARSAFAPRAPMAAAEPVAAVPVESPLLAAMVMPPPVSVRAAAPAAPVSAAGRLRLRLNDGGEAPLAEQGEPLAEIFRRLENSNRD